MDSIESNELTAKRDIVRDLAAHGFSDRSINTYTGCSSIEALQKAFLNELEAGPIDKNLEVARNFYEMATKGKSVSAATFWLRCRNGWAAKPASFIGDEDVNVIFSHADGDDTDEDGD
jgi:hypothetical protein